MIQMKLAILLLCSLIVFVLSDDDLERAKAKGKRRCSSPKGKPGAVRYEGCKRYECVKKKRKYYWEESDAKSRCCFYNDAWYLLDTVILAQNTSDDCCTSKLTCENDNGTPTVNVNTTNNCPNGPPNDPQCSRPYSVIRDTWRTVDYIKSGAIPCNPHCDDNLTPGWYRFVEPAGVSLPITPPPNWVVGLLGVIYCDVCQTAAAAWIQEGRNPALGEGIMNVTYCFAWYSSNCQWSTAGSAVACRDEEGSVYYLYNLNPTQIPHLAYCALSSCTGCSDSSTYTAPPSWSAWNEYSTYGYNYNYYQYDENHEISDDVDAKNTHPGAAQNGGHPKKKMAETEKTKG